MKDNSSKPIEWKSAEYHRKEILNLLDKISDSWILWQIHRCIVNMTREDWALNYKELIIGLLERIDSKEFPGRAGLVDSEKFLKRIYVSLRGYVRESEGEA